MKMGFLKDVFKKDTETLVVDRRKEALRSLIIFCVVLVVALLLLVFIRSLTNVDEIRRANITKDIQNVRNYVRNKATEAKEDSNTVLPGTSLQDSPQTLNINGVIEEYRYGYYLLNPEDFADMTTALNLTNEQYFVNYDTYDVVNVVGIKYKRGVYHSIDDLLAIENGELIPSRNTIIIKTAEDMEMLRLYPTANFKLAGNVDMSVYSAGEGWRPVEEFRGKLDGRGYTISNFRVNRPNEQYVGLFGKVTAEAKIMNLTFENVSVVGENYTGVLAGTMAGNATRIIVTPRVLTDREERLPDDEKPAVFANVAGQSFVGGLFGAFNQGTVSNCKVVLENVDGREEIGGFVGKYSSGTLQECYAQVESMVGVNSVGGFAGIISASSTTYMHECVANASISGVDYLGGLVGKIEILSNNKLSLMNSYSIGTITKGEADMGGLVGYISTSDKATLELEALYTTVDILNKVSTAGGCVGSSNVSIQSPCSVINVFWEKNLAPGEVLYGVGTTLPSTTGLNFEDKTSEEMKYRVTFANWSFDVWGIKEREATPYLKFENNF